MELYIETDLQEFRLGCMEWIDLAQDRDRQRAFVNAATNFLVAKTAGNCLTS